MKKSLLLLLSFTVSVTVFAQFTIGSDYVTFTGHDVPATNTDGQFYLNQPNGGGTFYIDNNCATQGTQGSGSSDDLGGFPPTVYDATIPASSGGAGRSQGILFAGGGIRRVYVKDASNNCNPADPSFGFYTGHDPNNSSTSGPAIDLSNQTNQKISFEYQLDNPISLELQLFYDANYTPALANAAVSLTADGQIHTFTLDFSSYVAVNNSDLANVHQVALIYSGTTKSSAFEFSIDNIKLGSAAKTTGVSSALASISNAKIYPNPASQTVTISLELKSEKNVKVILSDLLGKQISVIAEGAFNSYEGSVDISFLPKGIYLVNYFIDGAPGKGDLLVVR